MNVVGVDTIVRVCINIASSGVQINIESIEQQLTEESTSTHNMKKQNQKTGLTGRPNPTKT